MKKQLNNKGFTLIETVITFAIISIVGGMFILGFSNVVRLMTDAEIIKNDTNDLYGDVLASDEKDDGYRISLEIGDYTSNTDVSVTSKTVDSNSTTIRLSKFSTNEDVSWLPSDAQDSDSGGNTGDSGSADDPGGSTVDGETVKARGRIIKNINSHFPSNLSDLRDKVGWENDTFFGINIDNLEILSSTNSTYDLNGTVAQYVKTEPNTSQLKTIVDSSTNINYKSQLGNGEYKIFWFAVDMEAKENVYDFNSRIIPTVYGVIYPATYNKCLINICNNKIDYLFLPIVNNGENYSIDDQYKTEIRINQWNTVYIEGYIKNGKQVIITRPEELLKCDYVTNDKDIYFVYD